MNDILPLLYVGSILLGIILLIGMTVYKARRKTPADAQQSLIQIQNARERLVQEIASLDERYAAGRIHKGAYDSERTQQKRQLIEAAIQCKKRS